MHVPSAPPLYRCRHRVFRWAAAACFVLPGSGGAQPAASDTVEYCAALAAGWWKGRLGIEYDRIRADTAVVVCRAAVRLPGSSGALWAVLARAESRAGLDSDALASARRAIALGSGAGHWRLGVAYERGEGVEQSDSLARVAYLAGAEASDPLAQRNLAWMLWEGRGGTPQPAEGLRWLRRAAALRHPYAEHDLGWMHDPRTVDSVVRAHVAADDSASLDWYRSAVELGNAMAVFSLGGLLLERAGGTPADSVAACAWWDRALATPSRPARAATIRGIATGRCHAAALLPLLEDRDGNLRWQAVLGLGLRAEPSTVQALLRIAGNVPADAMAYALDRTGGDSLPARLGQFLADPQWRGLEAAILALSRRRDRSHVALVRPLLKHPDDGVRAAAARMLGSVADSGSVPALIAALADPERSVRRAALRALAHARDPRARSPLAAILAASDSDDERGIAASALGKIGDARALEALLSALPSPAAESCWLDDARAVVRAIAELGDARALPRLLALHRVPDLCQDDRVVVEQAIGSVDPLALHEIRLERVVGWLRDPDWRRRSVALDSLQSGVTMVDGRITRALADVVARATSYRDSLDVVEALGRQRDSLAGPLLRGLASVRDTSLTRYVLRDKALEAVARQGDSHAMAFLIAHLGGPHWWGATDLLSLLVRRRDIGPLVALQDHPDPTRRRALAEVLGHSDRGEVIPVLERLTRDSQATVRKSAAWALERRRRALADTILRRLLSDPDSAVRSEVRDWVAAVSDDSVTVALRRTQLSDRVPFFREQAIRELGRLADRASIPRIIAALSDPFVREAAATVLGDLGDSVTATPLRALLSDSVGRVKAAAALALDKLGDPRGRAALLAALDAREPLDEHMTRALLRVADGPTTVRLIERWLASDEEFGVHNALSGAPPPALQPTLVQILGRFLRLHSVVVSNDDRWLFRRDAPASWGIGTRGERRWRLELLIEERGEWLEPDVRSLVGEGRWRNRACEAVRAARAGGPGFLTLVGECATEAEEASYQGPHLERLWTWSGSAFAADSAALEEEWQVEGRLLPRAGRVAFLTVGARLHGEAGALQASQAETRSRYAQAERWARRALAASGPAPLPRLWLGWILAESRWRQGDARDALAWLERAEREWLPLVLRGGRLGTDFPAEGYQALLRGAVLAALDPQAALRTLEDASDVLECDIARMSVADGVADGLRATLESFRVSAKSKVGLQLVAEAAGEARRAQDRWTSTPARSALQQEAERSLLEGALRANLALAANGSPDAVIAAQVLAEQLALKGHHVPVGITAADTGRQGAVRELQARRQALAAIDARLAVAPDSLGRDRDRGGSAATAPGSPGDVVAPRDSLRRQRDAAWKDLKRFFVDLKRSRPEVAALLAREPVELRQWQPALASDQRIVQYLLLEDQGWAFVVGAGDMEVIQLNAGRVDVAPLVKRFREEVARARQRGPSRSGLLPTRSAESAPAGSPAGQALADRLLRPLAHLLHGVSRLLVVPNGPLHVVPFAALPWEGRPLLERFDLSVLSVTSLVPAVQSPPTAAQPALVVGNPAAPEPRWRPLPGAEAEARAVAALLLGDSAVVGAAARKKVLVGADLTGRIVHLAVHAEAGTPERTRLVLSDGYLTVGEVWGLSLEGSPLVVLSACETGVGLDVPGDEVVSLANGFLFAGARAVVSTLWPVDDEATRLLMEHFYRARAQGPRAALASAQRALARAGYGAYYWAAFVVHGM